MRNLYFLPLISIESISPAPINLIIPFRSLLSDVNMFSINSYSDSNHILVNIAKLYTVWTFVKFKSKRVGISKKKDLSFPLPPNLAPLYPSWYLKKCKTIKEEKNISKNGANI